MTDPDRIQASIDFGLAQHRVMDEADAAQDAQARRRELETGLALSGALTDRRLRDLVLDRLGAAAFSDEALELLDALLKVLAVGREADDGKD